MEEFWRKSADERDGAAYCSERLKWDRSHRFIQQTAIASLEGVLFDVLL